MCATEHQSCVAPHWFRKKQFRTNQSKDQLSISTNFQIGGLFTSIHWKTKTSLIFWNYKLLMTRMNSFRIGSLSQIQSELSVEQIRNWPLSVSVYVKFRLSKWRILCFRLAPNSELSLFYMDRVFEMAMKVYIRTNEIWYQHKIIFSMCEFRNGWLCFVQFIFFSKLTLAMNQRIFVFDCLFWSWFYIDCELWNGNQFWRLEC